MLRLRLSQTPPIEESSVGGFVASHTSNLRIIHADFRRRLLFPIHHAGTRRLVACGGWLRLRVRGRPALYAWPVPGQRPVSADRCADPAAVGPGQKKQVFHQPLEGDQQRQSAEGDDQIADQGTDEENEFTEEFFKQNGITDNFVSSIGLNFSFDNRLFFVALREVEN